MQEYKTAIEEATVAAREFGLEDFTVDAGMDVDEGYSWLRITHNGRHYMALKDGWFGETVSQDVTNLLEQQYKE